MKRCHVVKPSIFCQIKFTEWTRFDEAQNNKDAITLAAFYTEDVVLVTDTGAGLISFALYSKKACSLINPLTVV